MMNANNPNRVHELGPDTTATEFEKAVDAYIAALQAATYPSDTRARFHAIAAAESVGVDYIHAVASAIEHLGASFTTARFAVAATIGGLVTQMRENGAEARENVLATGRPANEYGLPEDEEYV